MSAFRPPCSPIRRLILASCGIVALSGLLACNGSDTPEPPGSFGPSGPLVITCSTGASSVIVGSGPVEVIANLTRNGASVSATTVSFSTTRGTVSPANSQTDGSGNALSFFQASATAGTAVITATAIDGFTGEAETCSTTIAVTEPRDPRLSVRLLTPTTVAGLNIQVIYDSARVTLPPGGVDPLPPFDALECVTISNDNDAGLVTLNMACPTLRATSGDVARFGFLHVAGDELTASDFAVSCSAFDERGAPLSAACSSSVLQL